MCLYLLKNNLKNIHSGIGIHTGEKVNMNILPASPNTGIVFKRIDIKENNLIYPLIIMLLIQPYATVANDFVCFYNRAFDGSILRNWDR